MCASAKIRPTTASGAWAEAFEVRFLGDVNGGFLCPSSYRDGRPVTMLRYPGNIPSNVNKDAKYSVVSGSGGGMEIRLIYRVNARRQELLTTDKHDRLVEMVNAVKVAQNGKPGGPFYINEYFDVLVPTRSGECFFADIYEEVLEFEYDGGVLGPVPPPGLEPGELWPGPHVGILYVAKADGNDIKYERRDHGGKTAHHLSDHVDASAVKALVHRLSQIKGRAGGRFYINEAGEFFTPMVVDSEVQYVYLGPLGDDPWFPPPDVPRP